MKRNWSITRTFEESAHAQDRWVRAYQLILQWTSEQQVSKPSSEPLEKRHESSPLYQGLQSDFGCFANSG